MRQSSLLIPQKRDCDERLPINCNCCVRLSMTDVAHARLDSSRTYPRRCTSLLLRSPFFLLVIAFVIRVTIILATHSYTNVERAEVLWVASSLAQHGTFADAFGPGTGFSIGAFVGTIQLLRYRNPVGWLCLAILTAYPSIYYFVESSARYRGPLDALLVFLTVYGVLSVFSSSV